jgi:hypothetical protein
MLFIPLAYFNRKKPRLAHLYFTERFFFVKISNQQDLKCKYVSKDFFAAFQKANLSCLVSIRG